MTNTTKINSVQYLVDNGYCVTDNICVFCSTLTDGWNRVCYSCNDYKGMMKLPQAIDTYGVDILGY